MSYGEKNKSGEYIVGRNAVSEALKSGRVIETVFLQDSLNIGSIYSLMEKIRESNITVKKVKKAKLDLMSKNGNHQGIIALAGVKKSATVEEILEIAKKRGEPPFVIVADEIEDPHNLGAIIRTAECVGAHGVIIPKRHSAGLTESVGKSAAGALEYVPVAKVSNISQTLDKLKKNGLWIYGADMKGQNWCETDFKGATALVIGSEGKGIGRLVREKCDFMVSLPMRGRINSLNASVAAGILMYEVRRQRG